jgi:uncharacterized protein with HEPN domain
MLASAKDAVSFAKNKTRADLDTDRQLTLSLLKCLEMIGYAASKVSNACKDGCEPIPWEEIIEMTREVVHTYWEIDLDWVWEKVDKDLPVWIQAIEIRLS